MNKWFDEIRCKALYRAISELRERGKAAITFAGGARLQRISNMRFHRVFVGAAALAAFFVLLGFRIGSAQRATVPFSGEQTQERRDRARFPHKSPKHRTLQCASCHQVSGATFEVESYPGHNACITCHNFAEMAVRDFSGYCGTCHTSLPSSKEEAKLFPFPKAVISLTQATASLSRLRPNQLQVWSLPPPFFRRGKLEVSSQPGAQIVIPGQRICRRPVLRK
jgi:hypothetical protein